MTESEQRNLFHSLPYAGNHNETGEVDAYGNKTATFTSNGFVWTFVHDESWDNVDFAGVKKL